VEVAAGLVARRARRNLAGLGRAGERAGSVGGRRLGRRRPWVVVEAGGGGGGARGRKEEDDRDPWEEDDSSG
jgi:hypothetical protein